MFVAPLKRFITDRRKRVFLLVTCLDIFLISCFLIVFVPRLTNTSTNKKILPTLIAQQTLGIHASRTPTPSPTPKPTPKPTKKIAPPTQKPTQAPTQTVSTAVTQLLNETGQGLLNLHVVNQGGWAWKSVIQAPNLQTDRDVGTSSVIIGLLALYDTTHNSAYLSAAEQGGNWLLSVAQSDSGGLRWPDYSNQTDDVADTHFTSFDDGTPGDADALWQLGQATGNQSYTNAAIQGMAWEMAQAQGVNGQNCPSQMCRWQWGDTEPSYQVGMGEGMAGIAYTFDAFAQRTGNQTYEQYAEATAAYIQSLMQSDGSVPETADPSPGTSADGDTTYDTGFLSGASGDAFMFMALYKHTGNNQYLANAQKILSWVTSVQISAQGGITWPISLDPDAGNDSHEATGIEEGNAGIGWVFIQAYKVTNNKGYLTTAEQAANWLLNTALPSQGGYSWYEDANDTTTPIHTSLDNGAPGIGWFLHDMYLADGNVAYQTGALQAVNWLAATAQISNGAAYWYENYTKNGSSTTGNLYQEPSWHWGNSGIAGFLANMSGWSTDSPGEEPGL
jgi:lantibiotic modifying enzyme